jgi:hypothetical protein
MTIRLPPAGNDPHQPSLATPAVTPTAPAAAPAGLAPATIRGIELHPLDTAGGLRILVEEVRTALLDQLLTAPGAPPATRVDSLSTAVADPGNAAATLLRWLQTVTVAGTGAPGVSLEQAVTTGYARALMQVAQMAGGSAVAAALEEARVILIQGVQQLAVPPFRADLPVARSATTRRRRPPAGKPERVDPVAAVVEDPTAPEALDERAPASPKRGDSE